MPGTSMENEDAESTQVTFATQTWEASSVGALETGLHRHDPADQDEELCEHV
jgi:hypothetical protein